MAMPSLSLSDVTPARQVRIVEVGPRDGLQNEPVTLPTAAKVELIRRLAAAGLPEIEATSFVSPRWVPALADAEAVMAELPDSGSLYSVLVPNERGYERARATGAKAVNVFISASDEHSRTNVNRTVAEHLRELVGVIRQSVSDGLRVRAYVSMVFGCPYEGNVPVSRVEQLTGALLEAGCDEISLGDTVGLAHPEQVRTVVATLTRTWPASRLALHFHDTRGLALANAYAGWLAGIAAFDGSVGGLGGCPYAAGASGNVATEELVFMFHRLGVETGVDLDRLCEAAVFAEEQLGRPLPSRYLQAWRGTKR